MVPQLSVHVFPWTVAPLTHTVTPAAGKEYEEPQGSLEQGAALLSLPSLARTLGQCLIAPCSQVAMEGSGGSIIQKLSSQSQGPRLFLLKCLETSTDISTVALSFSIHMSGNRLGQALFLSLQTELHWSYKPNLHNLKG